jgi:hypothetical protein
MVSDFRFYSDTLDHPKILKLIRSHGLMGFYGLIRLWGHAAEHLPMGVLTGMDAQDIGDISRIIDRESAESFAARLVELHLLDLTDGVYSLHNWDVRQPWASGADARIEKARHASRMRWASSEHARSNAPRSQIPDPSTQIPTPSTQLPTPRKTLDQPKADRVVVDDGFETFWTAYPRKVGKGAARKAWAKIRPKNGTREAILNAIAAQRNSDQWRKEGGQFIPHPATWLGQSRWEDSPDASTEMDPARAAVIREYRDADPNEDWTGRKS